MATVKVYSVKGYTAGAPATTAPRVRVYSVVGISEAAPNAPVASPGNDLIDVEPWATVTLTGFGTPTPPATITSYEWAQTDGTPALILSPNAASTSVELRGSVAGETLSFALTVTDSMGVSSNPAIVDVTTLPATELVMLGGALTPYKPMRAVTSGATATVPTGLDVDATVGGFTATWNPSTAGSGAPVTTYRVYVNNVLRQTVTGTSYTATNMVAGTPVAVQVSAVDPVTGVESAKSAAVNVTPLASPAAPTAPSNLAVVSGDGTARLTWTPPASGSPVGYYIYMNGLRVHQERVTQTIIDLLTNGTNYSWQVSAFDAAGTESALSAAVTGTPYPPLGPTEVTSRGPNGTHWVDRTPHPHLTAAKTVDVACTWAAIKTAVNAQTDAEVEAGVKIRVAPGVLPGAGASAGSTAMMSGVGQKDWKKRVLIVPRDGRGTVTFSDSVNLRQCYNICLAMFDFDITMGIHWVGCSYSAYAWSSMKALRISGLGGTNTTTGLSSGEITDGFDCVELVMPYVVTGDLDPCVWGSGSPGPAGSAGGNGWMRFVRFVGCYVAPQYRPIGGGGHNDAIQASGSGIYYGVEVRDSALWASTNCALQLGGTPGSFDTSVGPIRYFHRSIRSLVINAGVGQVRYPYDPATQEAPTSSHAYNGIGKNPLHFAEDVIATGGMYQNELVWSQVINSRCTLTQNVPSLSGSWVYDSALLNWPAATWDSVCPNLTASGNVPNNTRLNSIWSSSPPAQTPPTFPAVGSTTVTTPPTPPAGAISTALPLYTAGSSYYPVDTTKTTLAGPYPTNAWFENFMVGTGQQPIAVFPYQVKGTGTGLDICVPALNTSNSASVLATQLQNFSFRSAQTLTTQKVTGHTPLGATVEWAGTAGRMTATLVRGMAYVTMNYTTLTPVVTTQNAITSINGSTVGPTGTFSGVKFKMVLNNGQTWILYSAASITLNLTGSSTLTATGPMTGTLRLAILPTGGESTLDSSATCIPTGGTGEYSVSGNTATYILKFTTTGTGSLLMYTLPHHRDWFSPTYPGLTLTGIRGEMRAITGATWTMSIPLPTVGWNNAGTVDSSKVSAITTALATDKTFVPTVADPYFGGKQLAKSARLALIADQLGDTTARTTLLNNLKPVINAYLTGSALRYETRWGGIVSTAGLGSGEADFGNGRYNDHHFHYGYAIYAAAVIAKYDSAWLTTYKNRINDLVRAIANPSTADPYFTPMRHWDWYEGHSWAAGNFEFGDNRNQESTSEAVNAWYGLHLWGISAANTQLRDMGRVLMASEIATAKKYWQIKSTDTIYPAPFKNNGVVGILWSTKADYATWFGAQAEYIFGIQMLPITPATEALIPDDWMTQVWASHLNALWTRTSVWRVEMVSGGAGYVPANVSPTGQGYTDGLSASGGTGTGLGFNVNITGGQIVAPFIIFNQHGTGYTNGEIVNINGSGGAGAQVRVWTQPEDGWKAVILGAYAQINPSDAWTKTLALSGFDDGSSKTQALMHIATQ